MIGGHTILINNLRVTECPQNAPSIREVIKYSVEKEEWHPAGLSPSAILIINEFQESMAIDFDTPTPKVFNKSSWNRTCQQKIIDHYSRAARPSRGAIPSNCEAVVFTDIGEMLACYLLDVSTHQAQDRWWWHTITRRWQPGGNGGLENVISQNIRYLPAVFRQLTQWGEIHQVIQTLSPDGASRVLAVLFQEFGGGSLDLDSPLSKQVSKQEQIKQREEARGQDDSVTSNHDLHHKVKVALTQGDPSVYSLNKSTAWDNWIPDSIDLNSLTRMQVCLLVTALSIKKRPGILQDESFLFALKQLWLQGDRVRQNRNNKKSEREKEQTKPTVMGPYIEEARKIEEDRVNELILPKLDQQNNKGNQQQSHEEVEGFSDIVVNEPKVKQLSTFQIQETDLEKEINTQIGGIFYLINLMKQLHLPRCFEKDWHLSTQLGDWGVLDLIGRGLLGIEGDSFIDDPIWDMLACLNGRSPGSLPGESFIGADRYQLPAAWWGSSSGEKAPLYWSVNGKQLQIWFEEGYLLLEYPRKNDGRNAEIQAKEELQKYLDEKGFHKTSLPKTWVRKKSRQAPLDKLEGQLTRGLNPDLTRWLKRVLPAICYQLHKLLQLEDGNRHELTTFFQVPGKIYTTDTHIDLVTSLEEISLPIRQAGLDIDPGWVPELGQVVKFHYL